LILFYYTVADDLCLILYVCHNLYGSILHLTDCYTFNTPLLAYPPQSEMCTHNLNFSAHSMYQSPPHVRPLNSYIM